MLLFISLALTGYFISVVVGSMSYRNDDVDHREKLQSFYENSILFLVFVGVIGVVLFLGSI